MEIDMIKITEIAEKIVDAVDEAKAEMAEVLANKLEYAIKKIICEQAEKMFKDKMDIYCVQCGKPILYGQQYYHLHYSKLKIHYLCIPSGRQLKNIIGTAQESE